MSGSNFKTNATARSKMSDMGKDFRDKMGQSISVGEYYSYAKGALLPSIAFRILIIFIASILARSVLILYGRAENPSQQNKKNFDTDSFNKDFYLKYVGLILLFELLLNYLIMISLAGFKCISLTNEEKKYISMTEKKAAAKESTENQTGGAMNEYLPREEADSLHWSMFLPFPVFNDFLPNAGQDLQGLKEYEVYQWFGPAIIFFLIGLCINDVLGKTVFQKISNSEENISTTSLTYQQLFDTVIGGTNKTKDNAIFLKGKEGNRLPLQNLIEAVDGKEEYGKQKFYTIKLGDTAEADDNQVVVNKNILGNPAIVIDTNNEWFLDTFWIIAPTIYAFILLMFDTPISMACSCPVIK